MRQGNAHLQTEGPASLRRFEFPLGATLLIALISVVSTLAVCIWGLNRGLGWNDESYYILTAMYPEALDGFVTPQHWILAPLWEISSGLVPFRAIGLALLVAPAAILGAVVAAHSVPRHWTGRARGFAIGGSSCLSAQAALLYAATINTAPSYNLIAAVGLNVALAAWIGNLSVPTPALAALLGVLTASGCIIIFFGRPLAAGIVALGLLFAWLVPKGSTSTPARWIAPISMAGGLLTAAALLGAVTDWPITQFQRGLVLYTDVVPYGLLERAWTFVFGGMQYLALPLVLAAALAAFVVNPAIRHAPQIAPWITTATCLMVAGLTAVQVYRSPSVADLFTLLATLVILAAFTSWRAISASQTQSTVALLLLLMPFLANVGTANSPALQVVVVAAPWGAFLAFAVICCHKDLARMTCLGACAAVCAGSLAVGTVLFATRYPYDLDSPQYRQDQSRPLGAAGHLDVSPESARYIDELQSALPACGPDAETQFASVYGKPGLAIVLGLQPIGSPWLTNSEQLQQILEWHPEVGAEHLIVATNQQEQYPVTNANDLVVIDGTLRLCGMAGSDVTGYTYLWTGSSGTDTAPR